MTTPFPILLLLLFVMASETFQTEPVCLPRWDLNTRFGFESPFSTVIDEHLDETKVLSKAFKENYEGKLSSKSLFSAVSEYEQISIRRAMVSSYLHLVLRYRSRRRCSQKAHKAQSRRSKVKSSVITWNGSL